MGHIFKILCKLYLFSFLLIIPAQATEFLLQKKSILTIKGETNINQFHCIYTFRDQNHFSAETIIIEDNNLNLKKIHLTIPVNKCDCGNVLINKDFRNTLKADEHKNIHILINEIDLKNNKDGTIEIPTVLTIAGIKKKKNIRYDIAFNSARETISIHGHSNININDFDLNIRSHLFGAIKVKDHVSIRFTLNISPTNELTSEIL